MLVTSAPLSTPSAASLALPAVWCVLVDMPLSAEGPKSISREKVRAGVTAGIVPSAGAFAAPAGAFARRIARPRERAREMSDVVQ